MTPKIAGGCLNCLRIVVRRPVCSRSCATPCGTLGIAPLLPDGPDTLDEAVAVYHSLGESTGNPDAWKGPMVAYKLADPRRIDSEAAETMGADDSSGGGGSGPGLRTPALGHRP